MNTDKTELEHQFDIDARMANVLAKRFFNGDFYQSTKNTTNNYRLEHRTPK